MKFIGKVIVMDHCDDSVHHPGKCMRHMGDEGLVIDENDFDGIITVKWKDGHTCNCRKGVDRFHIKIHTKPVIEVLNKKI